MIFSTTSQKLQYKLGGASGAVTFFSSWMNYPAADMLPKSKAGVDNGTTYVDLTDVPGSGTEQNELRFLNIYNGDAGTVTVTINLADTTPRVINTVTLLTKEKLQYTSNQGWMVYDATGAVKTVLAGLGSGDMAKSVYDTDNNGTVDNSEKLGGALPAAYQLVAGKDASGGYAGLTLLKINFLNALGTFISFFTNANTASRTYTFQNRNGTIADDTDLALKAPLANPTFTGNVTVPTPSAGTDAANKNYVDNAVTGLYDFKGSTDCSANPNYPAALKGDAYVVSVAGKIGGASGLSVDIGDVYFATADNAGGTQASVGTSWDVLEHNLVGALLSANNLSDLTSAVTARSNLGLGTLATQNGTFSGTSSGINTGDQTNISGNAGTATALQTSRTIDGQGFDGTANITVIAPGTHAATSKATPVDADEIPLVDSAASNVLKRLTWANLKATIKSYFDGFYSPAIIGGCGGATVALSSTQYGPIWGSTTFAGVEGNRTQIIPYDCVVSRLFLQTSNGQPASGNVVFTIRRFTSGAASNTTITCTIPLSGGAGSYSDVSHLVNFLAGDGIALQAVNNATGVSANVIGWSVQLTKA